MELFENIQNRRVAIFIDEANIYHSQKTLGWKVDYQKVKRYFGVLGQVTLLNFYTSYQSENKKQTDFLRKLQEYGYTIISKQLKIIKHNGLLIKKGNLDIELALDAYRFQNKYDTLVLFSGDSDFAYLLSLLKKHDKKIIVCSTGGHISKETLYLAHKYVDIKKLKEIINL
jgi:uncharacterized LabA/DUF88 family protein